jgi:O-antigen/teichoic acid export membrane protein
MAIPKHLADRYFELGEGAHGLRHAAVSGATAMIGSKAGAYLIQLAGMVILSRLLTPNDFGLVAMVSVFAMILVEFGMLRLGDAVIQTQALTARQMSTLFWINQTLCVLLTVLVAATGPLMARFYGDARLNLITIALSVSFIFFGTSAQHMALLQRRMEFKNLAIANVLAVIASDAIAITLALTHWGYWAVVARTVMPPAVLTAASWYFCPWRPGKPGSFAEVREMVMFGLNSLGNYTMNYMTRSVDKVTVGRFFGADALGHYSKAYNFFAMPVNILSNSVSTTAVATLTRLRDDSERYRRYFLRALGLSTFVGMGVGAVFTVSGCDLLLILLGERWETAARLFYYLGPGIGPYLICGTAGWLFLSSGRADRFFVWGIANLAVTCLLYVAAIPFGMPAVALAYSGSFFVLAVPALWYAGKEMHIGIRDSIAQLWAPTFGAAIAVPLSWTMLSSYHGWPAPGSGSVVTMAIGGTVTSICYVLVTVLLSRSFEPVRTLLTWVTVILPTRSAVRRQGPAPVVAVIGVEHEA